MSENLVNIYEKKAEEMTAIHMITAKDKFEETEGGFVSLDYEGVHYERVNVVRLFPFSDADKYISVREHGNGGREIGIIEDMNEMSEKTREILDCQLRLTYFTPIIEKIDMISAKFNVDFVISMSKDKSQLSESVAQKVIVAL